MPGALPCLARSQMVKQTRDLSPGCQRGKGGELEPQGGKGEMGRLDKGIAELLSPTAGKGGSWGAQLLTLLPPHGGASHRDHHQSLKPQSDGPHWLLGWVLRGWPGSEGGGCRGLDSPLGPRLPSLRTEGWAEKAGNPRGGVSEGGWRSSRDSALAACPQTPT